MKKLIYTTTFILMSYISFFTFSVNASTDDNITLGDYQNISVYKLSCENDSTATYFSLSALYYPMDETVVIGDSHYGIESNPNYSNSNEPSSEFLYIVGDYFTNLY